MNSFQYQSNKRDAEVGDACKAQNIRGGLSFLENFLTETLVQFVILYPFFHILAERKNAYLKPAYALFYPVQNLHFLTSSESLVIWCQKRPLCRRYLVIFALLTAQISYTFAA